MSPADDRAQHPRRLWRHPEPKAAYDVVIVGGGGHGLATAYYLARNHGITNVAVVERGWLAGGNIARNTTIIRSNYLWDESAAIYEHSLKLWETLADELDYDLLFSQRGVHEPGPQPGRRARGAAPGQREPAQRHRRRVARRPTTSAGSARSSTSRPTCAIRSSARRFQPRGGIAKHDHVAWGYARAADALGVDLIQGCEVTGVRARRRPGHRGASPRAAGSLPDGSRSSRPGTPRCSPVMAGIRLPLQSHPLQALVSELLEPVHPTASSCRTRSTSTSARRTRASWSWAPASTRYNGYGQRGVVPHHRAARWRPRVELFPIFARAHVLRTWAGIVDVSPDASPIIGLDPDRRAVRQLRLGHRRVQGDARRRAGCYAHTIAHGAPHPLVEPFAPRPVHDRRADRRARRRRGGALMLLRSPARGAGRATRSSSATAGRRTSPTRPTRPRSTTPSGPSTCSCATTPRARSPSAGATRAGCRRWFNVAARHRDQRDPRLLTDSPTGAIASRCRPGRPDRPVATVRLHVRRRGADRATRATRSPRRCWPTASTASRRSIYDGRPRGIFAAGRGGARTRSSRSTAGRRSEPMLRATQVELVDGLVAEGLRRHAAGSRADAATRPATTRATRTATCWWSAAGRPGWPRPRRPRDRRAGHPGRRRPRPARSAAATGGRRGRRRTAPADVRLLPRTHRASGIYDHGYVGRQRRPTTWRRRRRRTRGSACGTSARGRVVLATGAHERPLVFADNDRPGIMLAGAAARLPATATRVRPGQRAVVFTTNDSAYAVARDLARGRHRDRGRRRRRAPARPSSTRSADDAGRLGAVVTSDRRRRRRRRPTADGPRRIACDLLAGLRRLEPGRRTCAARPGGRLRFDERRSAAFVAGPRRSAPSTARRRRAAGRRSPATGDLAAGVGSCRPRARSSADAAADDDWAKHFVDLQRDATVADLRRALAAGLRSVEHVKRYTTIGTGRRPGQDLGRAGLGDRGDAARPADVGAVGSTTFRPPYVPVSFAPLAGRDRGALIDPVRTTPIHAWHVAARRRVRGCRPMEAAALLPRGRRDMHAAVLRECSDGPRGRRGDGRLDAGQDRRAGPGRRRSSSTASTPTRSPRWPWAPAATA